MTNEIEYRCLSCHTVVRAKRPVELFCVRCQKVMQRWGETDK